MPEPLIIAGFFERAIKRGAGGGFFIDLRPKEFDFLLLW
jgi:hypothetical protein